MVHPKTPKSQSQTRQPSVEKPQPRIEIRCIDCECSDGDASGKLLGALLGVNQAMLEFLRSYGVKLELPCQNVKSKRRLVPL